MAFRIPFPHDQAIDADGAVILGAEYDVFANTTTTPVDLFEDRDASVPAANPVEADAAGRFPVIYVEDPDLLTLVLRGDSAPLSWDDIEPLATIDNAALDDYALLAGADFTGPVNFSEGAAVTAATVIDLDDVTGNFLHIDGSTQIENMTLAQGSMRWLVFNAAPNLVHSAILLNPTAADLQMAAGDRICVVGEGTGITRILYVQRISGKALRESAEVLIAVGDESTAITTGTAKITFRMPFAMTLNAIPRASLTVAQSAGSIFTVDINEAGASILSTKLTIDNNETTSETAATPCVLSDTALADNAVITIDVDQIGTSGAAGLKLLLRGYRVN